MNASRTAACAVIMTLGIATSAVCLAANNAQEPGYMIVRDKDNNACTLAAPAEGSGDTKTYNLTIPANKCENYSIRSMELYNLPSSTKILMTDSSDCSKQLWNSNGHRFWLELITRHKATSVPDMEIQAIGTFQANQMVVPGLQLTGIEFIGNSEALRDNLSCVRFTASSFYVPPTPASQPATPSR